MQVTVLFFGMLKDVAGGERDSLSLAANASVADLLRHYESHFPKLRQFAPSLAVSVNQEFAGRNTPLHDGDEVGLLPPVSGGQDGAPLVRIVRERIVAQEIVSPLQRPEDGAVVVFDGAVRNHSRGRRTLYLDYEAYESMAVKQLNGLAAQALERFPVRNVAIVHRLGRIEIGETSVLVAVYSAHRAPAFDACRFLIDTLKKTVPIWKKEYFEDGAVWADGEPFPLEIATSQPDRSLT